MLRSCLLSTLIGAISLIAPAFAADKISIHTAKGEKLIAAAPAKVAALDLGVLDSLYALGVDVGGVQENLLLPYLKEQRSKDAVVIGTSHEPNIEALVKYQPDLIILGSRSAKHHEPVARIANYIDMSVKGDNVLQEARQYLQDYGKLFGKQQRAAELISELDQKVNATKAAVANKGNALFVLVNGPKLSAYGKNSRFGWIHSELGIPEAVENIEKATHGAPISFEFIKESNPDWLLVFDRLAAIGKEGEPAAKVLDNELVQQTTAWKKGQVIYLDGSIYLAPGGVQSLQIVLQNLLDGFKK